MRKFILSALAIMLALGLAGAGAFAYLIDTETSTGNSYTAGAFDLKISDDNEGLGDGVTATWVMTNMAPGVANTLNSVALQNSGNIAGNHLEISFSHAIDEATNPVESDTNPNSVAADLAKWLEITLMTYHTTNFLTGYTDANGNGFFDLQDVTMPPYSDAGGPFDNLNPPPANSAGTRTFMMALKFNSGATNDIQGDILITTVSFTLNQDVSQ